MRKLWYNIKWVAVGVIALTLMFISLTFLLLSSPFIGIEATVSAAHLVVDKLMDFMKQALD